MGEDDFIRSCDTLNFYQRLGGSAKWEFKVSDTSAGIGEQRVKFAKVC